MNSIHWRFYEKLLHFEVYSFYSACHLVVYFFFFQAEDGIRDYKVTGVQTCALPISTAIISSNTFCFFVRLPARCHASPNSPPPRRFATATMPPPSSQTRRLSEK